MPYEDYIYCSNCDSEDLTYIATYADGEHWQCNECGRDNRIPEPIDED